MVHANGTTATRSIPFGVGLFASLEGETMSRESITWLNTNTLIGFTEKRGHAWHWRAEEQGDASNHYPGAIPITDVQDRLFYWQAESRRLAVEVSADLQSMTHLSAESTPARWVEVPERHLPLRRHRGGRDGHLRPGLQPPPVQRMVADDRC
jgi:hypothetical protein